MSFLPIVSSWLDYDDGQNHADPWFDAAAEEAMNCYCSVFKNSKVLAISRYTEAVLASPGRC